MTCVTFNVYGGAPFDGLAEGNETFRVRLTRSSIESTFYLAP
jgi:hypothetical protein